MSLTLFVHYTDVIYQSMMDLYVLVSSFYYISYKFLSFHVHLSLNAIDRIRSKKVYATKKLKKTRRRKIIYSKISQPMTNHVDDSASFDLGLVYLWVLQCKKNRKWNTEIRVPEFQECSASFIKLHTKLIFNKTKCLKNFNTVHLIEVGWADVFLLIVTGKILYLCLFLTDYLISLKWL